MLWWMKCEFIYTVSRVHNNFFITRFSQLGLQLQQHVVVREILLKLRRGPHTRKAENHCTVAHIFCAGTKMSFKSWPRFEISVLLYGFYFRLDHLIRSLCWCLNIIWNLPAVDSLTLVRVICDLAIVYSFCYSTGYNTRLGRGLHLVL